MFLITTIITPFHFPTNSPIVLIFPLKMLKSFINSYPAKFYRYTLNYISFSCFSTFEFPELDHILSKFSDSGDFRTALRMQTRLVKINRYGFVSHWNKLLTLYCKCGEFQFASKVFDQMPERDVVSFNTMISACVRRQNWLESLFYFKNMVEMDYRPNCITLSKIISACVGLKDSKLRDQFHGLAFICGLSSDEFVGCSLVDMYAEEMRLEDAIKAFNEISGPDLVSWNIMIDGCVRNKKKEQALRFFARMLRENEDYDGFTLTSIIKICLEPKDLYLGKLLHGCSLKTGLNYDTPICNALITMYSRCDGEMSSSLKIFGETLDPNIISWTAMIAGLTQNNQNVEAIVFYRNMLTHGVKENDFSLASILSVYSNLASLENGRQIHARVVKSCFVLDLSVNNALIDMYAKCGSLEDAYTVYTYMKRHDKVSCTTMITAFGHHGKGKEAIVILKEMKKEGLKPDDITFLGCLSACSHSGDVDEGLSVFKSMISDFNLKPRREHFSCVVDMLGRAGRLTEADKFIEEMGIGLEVFVWETMLGACRVHKEVDLGEKSANKINELKQGRYNGSYVLLANMYADRGLWESKGTLLDDMGTKGIKKETGFSWVSS